MHLRLIGLVCLLGVGGFIACKTRVSNSGNTKEKTKIYIDGVEVDSAFFNREKLRDDTIQVNDSYYYYKGLRHKAREK